MFCEYQELLKLPGRSSTVNVPSSPLNTKQLADLSALSKSLLGASETDDDIARPKKTLGTSNYEGEQDYDNVLGENVKFVIPNDLPIADVHY